MTIAIENQQRFGGGINYDMPYINTQFTNPWTSASAPTHSLYAPNHHQSVNPNLNLDVKPLQSRRLPGSVPLGSYSNVHVTTPSTGNSMDSYGSHQHFNAPQEILSSNRPVTTGYEQTYSTAPSPIQHSFPPNQPPYVPLGYPSGAVRSYAIQHSDNTRRLSQSSMPNDNRTIHDNIDTNRSMIALGSNPSHNAYGHPPRSKGSGEPYAFTGGINHSSSSSISSSSPFPSYYGSVDSSMGEYTCSGLPSNTSEIDTVTSRKLPRPSGFNGGGAPPAPQTMMGQFSSKVPSSTLKKHKCKVCDKRFTRPSSLQTHMYSHTGEKPFVCQMGGCGRQFSVVSNLRRHQKVHKNEPRSEAGSEEHQSDE